MVYKRLINSLSSYAEHECYLCGESFLPEASRLICNHCCQDLPRYSSVCQQCGIDLAGFPNTRLHCGPCLTRPPHFDRVIAPFAYAEPVRQLIASFKYQRQLAIGQMLSEQLIMQIKEGDMLRIDAILPVPLHPRRLRQRGFNQALELARPLARQCKLPLLINHVARVKNTLEQSSLSGKARRTNLKQAFKLVKEIDYPAIAIVDDVMTTGSTVEELSRLLKNNGVKYVEVWCLARAGHDR
jgi:ComF family protein